MPTITKNGNEIIFTNDDAIYKVGTSLHPQFPGRSIYLATFDTGQEVPLSDKKSTFAVVHLETPNPDEPETIHSKGLDYDPINGQAEEGFLKVQLNNDPEDGSEAQFPVAIEMNIHCRAESNHFRFELRGISITGEGANSVSVIAVAMAQIILEGNGYGGFIGAVRRDKNVNGNEREFLVAQVALNEETHIHSTAMSNDSDIYAILTTAYEAVRLEGVTSALVVCPKDEWLARIQALENQYSLPHPLINGIWDKQHPDVKTPYLFVDMTLENHQEIIQYAKRGGFKYVMPYRWIWSENVGSYDISEGHYGGNQDNLNTVAANLDLQGLKLGLHVMAFMVGKVDPLIRTDQVEKLAKEAPVQFIELIEIEEEEEVLKYLVINVPPQDLQKVIDTYNGYFGNGEHYILINKEIIKCASIVTQLSATDLRPAILVAERAALGTDSLVHNPGDTIYHLPEFFGTFLADPDTDLPDQIAQNFADVYNAAGARFAFLDGAEGARRLLPSNAPWVDGWDWYTSYQVAKIYRRYLNEHVLLESSATGKNIGHPWHIYSRGGSGDYATYAVEAFMDKYRIGRFRDSIYHEVAFPQELGWIALLARVDHRKHLNASYVATTPDEIEFQMNRSLGFDLPISLESNLEEMRENGFTNEIFRIIGLYEKLRRTYRVPDTLKKKLKEPGEDFTGVDGFLKEQYHLKWAFFTSMFAFCKFTRQVYLEKVLAPGDTWHFNNPFQTQALQLKITALPSHEEVDEAEYIPLINGGNDIFENSSAGTAVDTYADYQNTNGHIEVHLKEEQNPGDNYADKYNEYLDRYKWCSFRKEFDTFLDLSQHKVIVVEAEAISVAAGQVVCLQLEDTNGFQRLFQFVVDFSDTSQFLFPLPTGAAFYDYLPPNQLGVLFRWFNWSRVKALEIYVKHIPAEGIELKIHSMKALKQESPLLKNPEIELGGKTVQFPALLDPVDFSLGAEPWDFLQYDGNINWFNRFNGNNQLTDNSIHQPIITPQPATPPMVVSGANTLVFNHNGGNKAKALVRILLEGQNQFYVLRKQ